MGGLAVGGAVTVGSGPAAGGRRDASSVLLLPPHEHRSGISTTRKAARTACTGCGSALAPAAEWCWLCHRAVGEPVRGDVGTSGDVVTTCGQDRATVPTRWWRADVRPGASLLLTAALVAVLVPLLTLVLMLSNAQDSDTGGTTGLLGSGDHVDVSELDRPTGRSVAP